MASNTIGQLLVEIGLDSSKFNPELKKITQNIKGLEKELRQMNKDFGDTGKSITALEHKQELLNKVLSENQKALNMNAKEREAYVEMLHKQKATLDELNSAEVKDEKAIIKQEKAIQSTIGKISKLDNAESKLLATKSKYTKQMEETVELIEKANSGYKSYEERVKSINEQNEISNSTLKAQQNILEANGKKLSAYNKQVEIVKNSLKSKISTLQEQNKEISKVEDSISNLTSTNEENRKILEREISLRDELISKYGEEHEITQKQIQAVDELRSVMEQKEILEKSEIERLSTLRQARATTIEEATEEYKSLKELGSTEITKGLKYTSTRLEELSQATKGASAVGAGVGTGATAMFMTYESGLAKLSTLCDTSVVNMDKVGQDIIKISNETGTSIGEMMEGAYQAVSAGVEIDNLNDFLSTSSKLATSGFTDMSSATKVLSQILNNYGTSAGNAEEIASKLMKTQNLGVTTVAELSSEMSESLSLASTFGMNFDNIATAFAKMTKAGTSTNEAGTAIARMLEELGDTGSNVSQILKDKTGKSFTELAKGGSSLFDILTILQQHADETGVSMTELWGSSNAGKNFLCPNI